MIPRRKWIGAGLAATGLAGATAAVRRLGWIPPDHGGVYGIGEALTYAAHRALTLGSSHAREFQRADISPDPPVNGGPPRNEEFRKLADENFASWRLRVEGLVANPVELSLAELKLLPATSQITHMACEEGWSFIAEWTGVALSAILDRAGVLPDARYVVYHSFDADWWDSLDLPEARHPQTLLAYAMNGEDLPIGHGAPLRMRVPRQLGYKSVKHLSHITVTRDLSGIGDGQGSASPAQGYAWYAGI